MDSFVGRQIERKQHLRLHRSELSDAVSAIGGRPYFVDALRRRARPYFCASGEIRARPKLISVLKIRARPASARIFAESYSTCIAEMMVADAARAFSSIDLEIEATDHRSLMTDHRSSGPVDRLVLLTDVAASSSRDKARF